MSFIITHLNDREMVTEAGKDVLFVVSRREIRTKNISLHQEARARQEREGGKKKRRHDSKMGQVNNEVHPISCLFDFRLCLWMKIDQMCKRHTRASCVIVSFSSNGVFQGGRAAWCSWRGTKQGGYQRAAGEKEAAWNGLGTLGSKAVLKAIFP